jgi:hypothetical protein
MKIIGHLIKYVVIVVLLISSFIYFRVVVYYPRQQFPFKGKEWYNPYDLVDTGKVDKVNLHAHTHQWYGLTNGEGNSLEIQKKYAGLGYTLAQTSEYSLLNLENKIACYEHGFGVAKIHQLVLNAEKVSWFEYPFFQLTAHKQDILNRLRQDNPNATIVLAHPKLRNGYRSSEMSELSGYDLMEVVSRYRVSTEIWDSALVQGNPVFLLGSDDCHSSSKEGEIGRVWTYVFRSEKEDLISRLKSGSAVAMSIPFEKDQEIQNYHHSHRCPLFEVKIKKDSLHVRFSNDLTQIRMIGDGQIGEWMDVSNGEFLSDLKECHHYCRLELKNEFGVHLFLNPFVRSEKGEQPQPILASWDINYLSTIFHRLPALILLLISLLIWVRRNKFNKVSVKSFRILERKRMID